MQKVSTNCCSRKQINNGFILNQEYKFEEKIGQGQGYFQFQLIQSSFGQIWKVVNLNSKQYFACKVELKSSTRLLRKEVKVLQKLKNSEYYPELHLYGSDSKFNYMIMTCLGNNLMTLKKQCNGRLPLGMIINIGCQLVNILESNFFKNIKFNFIQDLHSQDFIHRDIKPDNIVLDPRNKNCVKLIDFGLSKQFKEEGQHIPFKENKGLVGTIRYASCNALLGYEQSRRDDLESIFYSLVQLYLGDLPIYKNYNFQSKSQKLRKITKWKQQIKSDQNFLQSLPKVVLKYEKSIIKQCLQQYFVYIKSLKFEDEPNYQYLKNLFSGILTNTDFYQPTLDLFTPKSNKLLQVDLLNHLVNSHTSNNIDGCTSEGSEPEDEDCIIDINVLSKQFLEEGLKRPVNVHQTHNSI